MFRALDIETREPLVILDAELGQLDDLRKQSRSSRLVCPGCNEPVRVKAGEVRRWHFAHKHRSNCPLDAISAPVSASKALLYQWLKPKYNEFLTFEKSLPGGQGNRMKDAAFYVEGAPS